MSNLLFLFFLTKWLSLSVEGLLSTGHTPSSLHTEPQLGPGLPHPRVTCHHCSAWPRIKLEYRCISSNPSLNYLLFNTDCIPTSDMEKEKYCWNFSKDLILVYFIFLIYKRSKKHTIYIGEYFMQFFLNNNFYSG